MDDTTVTSRKPKRENEVDLPEHFKQNGLSDQAYSKIARDVASGDINAKMLMNCGENELNDIADGYRFTWIQKKTFMNVVKLLNGYKNNDQQQFIYVSPHEQSILNEIDQLSKVLTKYTSKCIKIKNDNKNKLEIEILKLQEYNKLIQISFEKAINELIDECANEIQNNDEKFENLQNKIYTHSNDLKLYETQFKQYLNNKSKKENNSNNGDNISNRIKQTESNVNKLLLDNDKCMVPISIKNDLNVDTFISQFVKKLNDSFSFQRHSNDNDSAYDEKKENILDNSNTIGKSTNKATQQASNNYKINKIDWKFNFHYDYRNQGSKIHGVENNGKTMKCDWNDYPSCHCFSSISNIGMKPNSGIYTIKIKINDVCNRTYSDNIIGITSEKYDNNHETINNNNEHYNYRWEEQLNYIGWSACDHENDSTTPNGLFCGYYDTEQKHNIFRKNNFIYQSKNDNHKKRLPGFKTDDIIILSYNSTLNELSFYKENDNGKLDSCIANLPENMTFYWFVAHFDTKPMSISIVD